MAKQQSLLFRTSGGRDVVTSDDAGGFYCEHCFAVAGLTIGEGSAVGFLHVPPYAPDADADARAEHRAHIAEVIAVAVLGFFLASRPPVVRLLLTGYEAWGDVSRNPSGEVVDDAAVLRAALLACGFHAPRGPGLTGFWLGASALDVVSAVLPVDDRAIDGGEASVQRAIERARPHVVLSLGVHRDSARFRVERSATNRRLRLSPSPAHDEQQPRSRTLVDSDALARAIVRGLRARPSLLLFARRDVDKPSR